MGEKSSIQTICDLLSSDWHQRQTDKTGFNSSISNTVSSKLQSLTLEEIHNLFDEARHEIKCDQLKVTNKSKYPRRPQFIINHIFEPEDRAYSPKNRDNIKAYLEANLQACSEYFQSLVESNNFYDNFRSNSFVQDQVQQMLFQTRRLFEQCKQELNISTTYLNTHPVHQSRIKTVDFVWLAKDLFEKGAVASPVRPANKAALMSVLMIRKLLESSFKRLLGFSHCYNPDNGNLHEVKTNVIVDFIKEEINQGKIHTSWEIGTWVDRKLDVKDMGYAWVDLKLLIKVYGWCNVFTHQDMHLCPWQVYYALKCCSFLIRGGAVNEGSRSTKSIDGWVKIVDYDQVKKRLIERLAEKVECDKIEIVFNRPEAIALGLEIG